MDNYINHRRKWREDMSDAERDNIKSIVRSYDKWKITKHAKDEMREDRITANEIRDTMLQGRVLEIHNCKPNDLVVLLQKAFATKAVTVVLSLVSGAILTTWKNALADAQRTPNLNNYQWHSFNAEALTRIGHNNLWIASKDR